MDYVEIVVRNETCIGFNFFVPPLLSKVVTLVQKFVLQKSQRFGFGTWIRIRFLGTESDESESESDRHSLVEVTAQPAPYVADAPPPPPLEAALI